MTIATPMRTHAWTFFGRTPGGFGALSLMTGDAFSLACWVILNLGSGRLLECGGRP